MPQDSAPPAAIPGCGPGGGGLLFYVIGPSGAGKDSLIAHARAHLDPAAGVLFAHRYITRPADAGGENHVALSPAEFAARAGWGCFCLSWDSHGLRYGIGEEVRHWLGRGLSVVVNGSRGALAAAEHAFGPALRPVAVRVEAGALRARLEARGRESPADIKERLARAAAFTVSHPRLVEIDNSGPLATGGAALLRLLGSAGRAGAMPPAPGR